MESAGPRGSRRRLAALILALSACAEAPPTGFLDASAAPDAAPAPDVRDVADVPDVPDVRDAEVVEVGPLDVALADLGLPEPGRVGLISGTCGVLDDELTSAEPTTFENNLLFDLGYTMADQTRLTPGAQEILREGTAGGSSGLSEAFAFEVLARCEGAALVKTETEVLYDPVGSKKTDILVEIDGLRIGVSVTRAVGFPRDAPYTVERARSLLDGKLADILVSSANVVQADQWRKQILHVIAYSERHVASLRAAIPLIDPAVRADTIIWVTQTDGQDEFLY